MTSYTNDINKIIEQESAHIQKSPDEKQSGLSISSGGIRSASFAMGVLQALVADEQLEKMDSGKAYGTQSDNFPFGRKREGNKHNDKNAILDFIRQHGNYLIPGHGLGALSLAATPTRA